MFKILKSQLCRQHQLRAICDFCDAKSLFLCDGVTVLPAAGAPSAISCYHTPRLHQATIPTPSSNLLPISANCVSCDFLTEH